MQRSESFDVHFEEKFAGLSVLIDRLLHGRTLIGSSAVRASGLALAIM